ncbi:hypothetical protein SteCoe_8231 [Stentor coeruleus]|uniref:Uncharacterized protein n=1 Tax=Stentor coeruleus TaxID=5963 RepID=A0A1R2CKR1_9CILI|nr:hypothetical protein SteCoe_8231 [Stentor coeruleus]
MKSTDSLNSTFSNFKASNPTEMIAVLTAFKEKCVAQGKYLDAEKAKQKILKLKVEEAKYKENELKQRQQKDTEEVEQGHIQDFQEFNQMWEKELSDFEESCRKQIEELRTKHEQELESTRETAETAFNEKQKPSQKKIDLLKARDSAVKIEEYLKAHSISQELSALEKDELASIEIRKKEFIKKALAKVEDRQEIEMEGLKNRLRRTHEELKRKRGMEMERVIKRFQNNKKELERAQTIELSIASGKVNTPSAWNMMESNSISRILQSSRAGTPGLMLKSKIEKESPDKDNLFEEGENLDKQDKPEEMKNEGEAVVESEPQEKKVEENLEDKPAE